MKKTLLVIVAVLLGLLMVGCTTFGVGTKELKSRVMADERHIRLEELKEEMPESACKKVKKSVLGAIRAGEEIIEIYHYLVLCGKSPLMRDEKTATSDALFGAGLAILESRLAAHYSAETDSGREAENIVREVLEISWPVMKEAAGLLAKL